MLRLRPCAPGILWWILTAVVSTAGVMLALWCSWSIIAEPFTSIWHYAADAVIMAAISTLFLSVPLVLLIVTAGVIVAMVADLDGAFAFNRQGRWSAMFLGPFALLLGAHVGSWALFAVARRDPSDWLNGPPASPEILLVSFVLHAMALLIGLLMVIAGLWLRRFDTFCSEHVDTCRSCGYELRGLPSTVCPECGSEVTEPDMLGTCR